MSKATKNAKIMVVWGVRGHPRSSETLPFDRAHMTSYSTFIAINDKNCRLSIALTAMDKQEALLLQRDSATHLSVEILQLQNISFEN